VRVWLFGDGESRPARAEELFRDWSAFYGLAFHPDDRHVVAGAGDTTTWLIDIGTKEARLLETTPTANYSNMGERPGQPFYPVAVSPNGRYVAGGGGPEVLVWDLEANDVFALLPEDPGPRSSITPANNLLALEFTPDSKMLAAAEWQGLRLWDLETRTSQLLGDGSNPAMTRDSKIYTTLGWYEVFGEPRPVGNGVKVYDLVNGESWLVPNHPKAAHVALDPTEQILVTGSTDGTIRVGPINGEEPHLLLGHEGTIFGLDVSPDGRWIASSSEDGSVRVWPMPDVTKPPLHTLPREELLDVLHRLTNFRAVEDPSTASGYSIEYDPFPGWRDYPEWMPLVSRVDAAGRRPVTGKVFPELR
jgi:WD40 repeat protein